MNNKSISLRDIVFIDIETTTEKSQYNLLSEPEKSLWKTKANSLLRFHKEDNFSIEELYIQKGAIYAEFSRIICISVGYFKFQKNRSSVFKVKSFFAESEKTLLQDFAKMIRTYFKVPTKNVFCGHNIREFDIPFICRRLIINGISLPEFLNIGGKRPWQVPQLIDTLELWKFGDYKHYISLSLLSHILGIEEVKSDMSGDQVHRTYWEENNINKIVKYCESDVFAVAKVYAALSGDRIENVEYIAEN